MIEWIERSLGETASIVVAVLLLILAIASEVGEWLAWTRLRREPKTSRARRRIEFTSVTSGTGSILLFALFWIGAVANVMRRWTEQSVDFWIFAGMGFCGLALIVSPLCRGNIRLAGIVGSVVMADLWWELWNLVQFGRAYGG